MRIKFQILSFCLLSVLFTGCKNESSKLKPIEYLPVQMAEGDNWSILDKNGNSVVEEEYPSDGFVTKVSDGMFWVISNGKFQLFSIENPKKPVVDNEFSSVTSFKSGVAVVTNPNQPIRIINTNGEIVATLPKSIRRCYEFSSNGYAYFMSKEKKMGVIDSKGNIRIKADYSELKGDCGEGVILARRGENDKKMLILDLNGNINGEIDTNKYYLLNNSYQDGKIIVRDASDENGHSIILDKTGKKLFEIKKAIEKLLSYSYIDGFLIIDNGEGKYGVADEEGEIVIRPKYDFLSNAGNGEFFARKGEKVGVINANDEIILSFDYELGLARIGDNFLMKDDHELLIVDREGKEITSFHNVAVDTEDYVDFVDIDGITEQLVEIIEGLEKPVTAKKLAQERSLSIDDYHYQSYSESLITINDKVSLKITTYFDGQMAEEKTHQEEVNDGWFTYNRTVNDGWQWTDNLPSKQSGTLSFEDTGISIDIIFDGLCTKLGKNRKKISSGVYSKIIKAGDKSLECRTGVEKNNDKIQLEILFRE